MNTATRRTKKQNDVLVEDFDGGQRKITVNGKTIFDDDSDNFTMWTMVDVLNALGVKWDHKQLANEESE